MSLATGIAPDAPPLGGAARKACLCSSLHAGNSRGAPLRAPPSSSACSKARISDDSGILADDATSILRTHYKNSTDFYMHPQRGQAAVSVPLVPHGQWLSHMATEDIIAARRAQHRVQASVRQPEPRHHVQPCPCVEDAKGGGMCRALVAAQ